MFCFSRDRRLVGTFVKTASPHVVEVLGHAQLDFIVLDAEHGPFTRDSADLMLLAAQAVQLPTLVRVPDHSAASIGGMLDLGAAGVVVPHVDSPEQARTVVAYAHFTAGQRGFSPSPRFGGYGTRTREQVLALGDAAQVVCQIESREGLAQVQAIAHVPGVAALFIGRADLSLSLQVDSARHPKVMSAVHQIFAAANEAGLSVLMALDSAQEMAEFAAMGTQGFVIGSDQSLMRRAAAQLRPMLDEQPAAT